MFVLPEPEQKAAYVQSMFTAIAQRYDYMNRLMTFGLDQGWRRWALQYIAGPDVRYLLDVGSGTGDFVCLAAKLLPHTHTVGLDFTLAMLQAGLPRIEPLQQAAFVNGDALTLPFETAMFDAVTTGFTMRNVLSIEDAFREMARVTRPGGRLACLEVARPRNPLVRLGHQFYFNHVVPLIGAVVGGSSKAYSYLPQSAQVFPPPEQLARMLEQTGWTSVSWKTLGLGAVAVHTAVRSTNR